MASSLAKAVVSNRSTVLFRPVITSCTRFFNTKPLDDNEDNNATFIRECPPFLRDLLKAAHCPHSSATRNLSDQLNLMDDRLGVRACPFGYRRWSAGEYERGFFYILRGMRGLHLDAKECVPSRDMRSLLHLTHFDTPCPTWDVMKEAKELDQLVESTRGMHVISSVHVFRTMRYIPAIYIIIGHEGPNPQDLYEGYVCKIYLPRRFYMIEYVSVRMGPETLVITIPKKYLGDNPIYKIEADYLFFRERKGN